MKVTPNTITNAAGLLGFIASLLVATSASKPVQQAAILLVGASIGLTGYAAHKPITQIIGEVASSIAQAETKV
jgi:hypothetical protein